MERKRLKYCPYGQCHVIKEPDMLTLVSYTTKVIIIDYKNDTIECTGTYSPTTRRHIGYFLKEYYHSLCYSNMRRIAGEGPKDIAEVLRYGTH